MHKKYTPNPDDDARFWLKVDKNGPMWNRSQCWTWQGWKTHQGYGLWNARRAGNYGNYLAHRVAYTIVHGEFPEGLITDHLCRNPSCVNPDHLEPVNARENCLRGESPAAIHYKTPLCKHGHEFTPDNNFPSAAKRGHRNCITCRRIAYQAESERLGRKKPELKTHCTNGHPFPEGTEPVTRGGGIAACRMCNAERAARWRAKRDGREYAGRDIACAIEHCGQIFTSWDGTAFCSDECRHLGRLEAWQRGNRKRRPSSIAVTPRPSPTSGPGVLLS